MLVHKGIEYVWEHQDDPSLILDLPRVRRFIELREVSRAYSLDDAQAAEFITLHSLVIQQGRSGNAFAAVETVKRLLGGALIPHLNLKVGLLAEIKVLFIRQVELLAGLDHYTDGGDGGGRVGLEVSLGR